MTTIDTTASDLLRRLLCTLETQQRTLLFSNVSRTSPFAMSMFGWEGAEGRREPILYEDHDLALEWCENQILSQYFETPAADAVVPLSDHLLCQGLAESELAHLQTLLMPRSFEPGERILQTGHTPEHLYFSPVEK
ncbi:hypothetical protein C2W62_44260 [Candidatus Entotheonella serta]|nr:hypothetical protein C2W62_44260 [Candidatus Entotheonella serta]